MKHERASWIGGMILFAVGLAWFAWSSTYDHDEIEHLHAAWLISQGQLPFRDFMEHHHPALWYLLAPIVRLFSDPARLIVAIRCIDLAGMGALLAIIGAMIRKLVPGGRARWALVMLAGSFMFVSNSMEIRPDPWMNLFVFLGLFFWISFLDGEQFSRAVAAGICFGIAIAVLQKALVTMALVMFSSLILVVIHRRERGRATVLAQGSAVAMASVTGVLALAAWLIVSQGIWDDFLFWNYPFNRALFHGASDLTTFSAWRTLGRSIAQDPALWVIGGAGGISIACAIWRRRRTLTAVDDRWIAMMVVAVGSVVFPLWNRIPHAQHYLCLLPVLAIFAAVPIHRWRGTCCGIVICVAAALMIVELVILAALFETNGPQRKIQAWLIEHTGSEDALAVPPPVHPLFRRDGGYFWFNATRMAEIYRQYCGRQACRGDALALDRERWISSLPVAVFVDSAEPSTHPLEWGVHVRDYESSPLFEGLFLRRK